MTRKLVLEVRKGRSLVFSPAWSEEEASVVFDRNSGDYWVIPEISRRLLALVKEGSCVDVAELRDQLTAETRANVEPRVLSQILDDLVAADLLTMYSAAG